MVPKLPNSPEGHSEGVEGNGDASKKRVGRVAQNVHDEVFASLYSDEDRDAALREKAPKDDSAESGHPLYNDSASPVAPRSNTGGMYEDNEGEKEGILYSANKPVRPSPKPAPSADYDDGSMYGG